MSFYEYGTPPTSKQNASKVISAEITVSGRPKAAHKTLLIGLIGIAFLSAVSVLALIGLKSTASVPASDSVNSLQGHVSQSVRPEPAQSRPSPQLTVQDVVPVGKIAPSAPVISNEASPEANGPIHPIEPVRGPKEVVDTARVIQKDEVADRTYVLNQSMNLRGAPSVNAALIEEMKPGTHVVVGGPAAAKGWHEASIPNGSRGFINDAALLKATSKSTNTSPTPIVAPNCEIALKPAFAQAQVAARLTEQEPSANPFAIVNANSPTSSPEVCARYDRLLVAYNNIKGLIDRCPKLDPGSTVGRHAISRIAGLSNLKAQRCR